VLEITLARPEAMNALTPAMRLDLLKALEALESDSELRAGLITGSGSAFCSGADLVELSKGSRSDISDQTRDFYNVEPSKPLVAAVNGHCLAAGLGLALLCDVRIAAENATFGTMGTARGVVPAAGQTQRLPRAIGLGQAMWLLLSAERIDAQEALRIGLVNKVVAPADLMPTARDWADRLAAMAPLAVVATKKLAIEGLALPLTEAMALETEVYQRVLASEDAAEGIRSFAERRPPEFRGR
jgi:enoyl-CoA hydratase/carnithine racemase